MKTGLYTPDELRWRPIEHTLELMTSVELAAVAGCDKNSANRAIRGDRDLEPREVRSVRRWLETAAGRSIPVDEDPCEDGSIVVDGGVCSVFKDAATAADYAPGEPRYRSYFVTCPRRSGGAVAEFARREGWRGRFTSLDFRNSARARRLRREVFLRDDFTCQICGYRPPQVPGPDYDGRYTVTYRNGYLQLDHIKPRSKGGALYRPDNVQTLCSSCNARKGDS